jgi:RimJ/RimL family protein N-acetyltransferase
MDATRQTSQMMTEQQQPILPEDALALDQPIRLIDGQVVRGRPILWDDDERLRAFHARLSPDSIVFRFFSPMPTLTPDAARHFTHVDYENRMALVATTGTGPDEQIIGVVRYDRLDAETAEVAFVVQDKWQGHGIATQLLHRLAPYAKRRGINTFMALTMMGNGRMLDVLRNAGYPYQARTEGTDLEVRLAI